jgi:hypothetical protein
MALAGSAAAAAALGLNAPATAVVSTAALYAGAGYYAARHPDVLWGGERSTPDWAAGAFGGGLSFGLVGLVGADVAPWLLLFGFGFVAFGFVTGVAYARESPASPNDE